jgi:DNA-binding NtrC family response regulator
VGTRGARRVVLVGNGHDWPADLEPRLASEGYATERRAELDEVLPLIENVSVHALVFLARPLAASDLLLLKRIRAAVPRTAIVAITNQPTSPDLKRAFESGATAFLSWPASKEALRQAVDSGDVRTDRP